MSYKAMRVVNTFIELYHNDKEPITQVTLLKLLYFANATYLVLTNKPLIKEDFCAWAYGPVVLEVYEFTKYYGANPIGSTFSGYASISEEEDKEAVVCIKTVCDYFKDFSPFELLELTHKKNGAWDKAYERKRHSVIKTEDILEEYKKIITIKE